MCCLYHVQVLARSSPEDKLTLVSMLKKEGEVVAVTGGCESSVWGLGTIYMQDWISCTSSKHE